MGVGGYAADVVDVRGWVGGGCVCGGGGCVVVGMGNVWKLENVWGCAGVGGCEMY